MELCSLKAQNPIHTQRDWIPTDIRWQC